MLTSRTPKEGAEDLGGRRCARSAIGRRRTPDFVPEPVCNSLSSIPETWQGYCVTSALSATSRLHLCEGLSGFAVHTVAGAYPQNAVLLVLRSRRPRRTAAILSLPILRGPLCLTVSSSTPGLLGFAPAECLFAAAKCIFAALVSPRPILRGPLGLTISRDSLPTLLLPPNASLLPLHCCCREPHCR